MNSKAELAKRMRSIIGGNNSQLVHSVKVRWKVSGSLPFALSRAMYSAPIIVEQLLVAHRILRTDDSGATPCVQQLAPYATTHRI
jgi:hypothetical protein